MWGGLVLENVRPNHGRWAASWNRRITRERSSARLSPVVERVIVYLVQHRTSQISALTRTDLVQEVSRVLEIPLKEGEALVEQIIASMVRALRAGDKIELRGFGSFHIRHRNARLGRNPKTGAKVAVPAKNVVFFKPSK